MVSYANPASSTMASDATPATAFYATPIHGHLFPYSHYPPVTTYPGSENIHPNCPNSMFNSHCQLFSFSGTAALSIAASNIGKAHEEMSKKDKHQKWIVSKRICLTTVRYISWFMIPSVRQFCQKCGFHKTFRKNMHSIYQLRAMLKGISKRWKLFQKQIADKAAAVINGTPAEKGPYSPYWVNSSKKN